MQLYHTSIVVDEVHGPTTDPYRCFDQTSENVATGPRKGID